VAASLQDSDDVRTLSADEVCLCSRHVHISSASGQKKEPQYGREVGLCQFILGRILRFCGYLQAWQWLVEYTRLDFQGKAQELRDSKSQRERIRFALQRVMAEPNAEAGWSPQNPEVLIGIVTSDVRLGVRALRDWAQAFNADYIIPEVRVCFWYRISLLYVPFASMLARLV
jgi:hypothetical protein